MGQNQGACQSVVVASKMSCLEQVCRQILTEAQRQNYTEDDVFAIHLALEEAFVNAVRHGNKDRCSKTVKVEYLVSGERIEIYITDEGRGFDPNGVPDPRCGENLYKTSGRGLLLMRAFMNKVEFNSTGNSVRLVRYKNQPSLPSSEQEV
jgi:serine/threonine-protein kinase RsbW